MLSAFIALNGLTIMSCQTIGQRENDVTEGAIEADNLLKADKSDYENDVKTFRQKMNKIIASHDHNIAEYKVKIKNDRKEHQTDYSETVFELELKNSYMKVKLDNYTMEGKDKWETFKGLFIRDMEKLNIEFTDFSTTI
jgi:hypothetical protein